MLRLSLFLALACFVAAQVAAIAIPTPPADDGCQPACTHTKCGFGGTCKLQPDGSETCTCFVCPVSYIVTNHTMMVCGSDGKSYGNACQVRRASCLQQRSITVAHNGKCAGECPKKSAHQSQPPIPVPSHPSLPYPVPPHQSQPPRPAPSRPSKPATPFLPPRPEQQEPAASGHANHLGSSLNVGAQIDDNSHSDISVNTNISGQ